MGYTDQYYDCSGIGQLQCNDDDGTVTEAPREAKSFIEDQL